MLKRIKQDLNSIKLDSDESGKQNCYSQVVLDAEATSKAISACDTAAQAKIDDLLIKIEEYENKLVEYKQKELELSAKKEEAAKLSNSYTASQRALNAANINYDLHGCHQCIVDLYLTFEKMRMECKAKIEEYEVKLQNARESLDKAKAEKIKCQSIRITKTILICN